MKNGHWIKQLLLTVCLLTVVFCFAGANAEENHNFVDGWCTICGEPENCVHKGDCGDQGDNVKWYLTEDGTLYICGNGAIKVYPHYAAAWADYRESITSVKIQSGVDGIGDYAFFKCENLSAVSIPDTVEYIYMAAFESCSSLKEIAIPDSVTDIRRSVFSEPPVTITCSCDSAARAYADEKGIPVSIPHNYVEGFCTVCGAPENCIGKGNCGDQSDNVRWFLTADGKMNIRGTGAMTDYSVTESSDGNP